MDPHTPKACIPFLTRAKELATKDPVIAYWCKFMAANLALDKLDSLDDSGKAALEGIINDLEQTKASLSDNELVTDDTAGSAYIYNFASRVFDGADATDRGGKATRATAKEFLAASNFFELLSIFGPLETDVNEKITYAKWKASSIAKAFREGRTPTPGPANAPTPAIAASSTSGSTTPLDGPPHEVHQANNDSSEDVSRQLLGQPSNTAHADTHAASNVIDLSEDQDGDDVSSRFSLPPPPAENPGAPPGSLPSVPDGFSSSSSGNNASHPLAPPDEPSFPTFPSSSSDAPAAPSRPPVNDAPTRSAPEPSAPTAPPIQSYDEADLNAQVEEWQPDPTTLDPTIVASAQKHAKWAISALNYDDVETARLELRKALELIGG